MRTLIGLLAAVTAGTVLAFLAAFALLGALA